MFTEPSTIIRPEQELGEPNLQDFHVAQPPKSTIHQLCHSISLHFQRLQSTKPLERESIYIFNLVSVQLPALKITVKRSAYMTNSGGGNKMWHYYNIVKPASVKLHRMFWISKLFYWEAFRFISSVNFLLQSVTYFWNNKILKPHFNFYALISKLVSISIEANELIFVFKLSSMRIVKVLLKHEVYLRVGLSSLSCSSCLQKVVPPFHNLMFNTFSLRQSFSTLVAHWNHLGHFKNYWSLALTPRRSNIIALGCGLGTGIFESSPSVCNVQLRLKTTILQEPVHRSFYHY